MDDLKALRPTIFPSVPRLLNRIRDKLLQGVTEQGGIKQTLFEKAYSDKLFWLRRGEVAHSLWDALVFGKIKVDLIPPFKSNKLYLPFSL